MNKTLVSYFSAGGNTAKVAKIIAEKTKGDLFEIRPAVPYTAADLNWHDKQSRSSLEMNDKGCRPAVAAFIDVKEYDRVFVGFPIWWYEAPRVIQTFLEGSDLSGKTVILFATSGGSDLGETASILKKSCPDARILSGRRFSPSVKPEEVSAWLETL